MCFPLSNLKHTARIQHSMERDAFAMRMLPYITERVMLFKKCIHLPKSPWNLKMMRGTIFLKYRERDPLSLSASTQPTEDPLELNFTMNELYLK